MLRLTRLGGGVGYVGLGVAADPETRLGGPFAIPAGAGNTLETDIINVCGFNTFMLIADVALADAELQIVHVNPESNASIVAVVHGAMGGPAVNLVVSFGRADTSGAPTNDEVFGLIRLRWRNTSGAVICTISNPKLWGFRC